MRLLGESLQVRWLPQFLVLPVQAHTVALLQRNQGIAPTKFELALLNYNPATEKTGRGGGWWAASKEWDGEAGIYAQRGWERIFQNMGTGVWWRMCCCSHCIHFLLISWLLLNETILILVLGYEVMMTVIIIASNERYAHCIPTEVLYSHILLPFFRRLPARPPPSPFKHLREGKKAILLANEAGAD